MITRRESNNYIKKEIGCSSDGCDIWTTVSLPKSIAVATLEKADFLCGFSATKRLAELEVHHKTKTEPTYAEMTKNMENSSLCATIVEQVKAEEKQRMEKSNNLVIHGLKADKDQTDKEMLTDLASAVSVTLKEDDFTTRRIKNKNNANANPLLIITFKDAIKRLKLPKSSKKLKDCDEFKGVFINPDYTKAEQAQQSELRQELRTRSQRETDSEKTWIIRNNMVVSL